MNINDLYTGSKDAADDGGFAPTLDHNDLPEGTKVLCEVTYSAPGKTTKGATKFTNKLKVIEDGHPHQGGEFFDGLNFSVGKTDGQKSYNKRLFAKLEGAGLGEAFWSSNPSEEAIAKALVGQKINVTIRWQAPNSDGKVWLDNTTTWAPAGGGFSESGY